jgi:L-arabinokinase
MELIRALLATDKFAVHVVTHVKAEFFHDSLKDFNINPIAPDGECIFSIYDRNLDTGAAQADVFVVDALQTLSRYYEQVHLHRQKLIDYEVSWLREHKIQLVLVDAIPLGCLVGSLAGARTVLVSNFSWDFCFKEMLATVTARGAITPEVAAQYAEMVQQCEADSSACDRYLQLPGATPWPTGFPAEKVLPGPLIARQPRRHSVREERGVSADAKVLLLGFGGHSAEWHLKDSYLPDGWQCFVLGRHRLVITLCHCSTARIFCNRL